VELLFDILQGAGLAAAAGIRPFLPALLAGALASGDLGLDFDGTRYAFLESPAFLLAVVLVLVAVVVFARRLGPDRAEEGAVGAAVDAALAANAAAVADYRAGKEQALGFLVGQVMKATRGQANAALVGAAVRDRLDAK